MDKETPTPEAETEAEGMATPESETRFQRPSRTRKALVSVLGGLGIFAATNVYDVAATTHNNGVLERRATAAQEEKEKNETFDLTRAKIAWAVDLDKNNQPENDAE